MKADEKIQDNPVMRYHLGMAYFKNGEKENAKKELKKSSRIEPKIFCSRRSTSYTQVSSIDKISLTTPLEPFFPVPVREKHDSVIFPNIWTKMYLKKKFISFPF